MTTTRYLLAKLALAFGFSRRARRMAEAASETHLLREAEQILGRRVWDRVEGIEELGIEYWNLRRLFAEREKLLTEHAQSESMLADAHEQRATLLGAKTGTHNELETRRRDLLAHLEALARQRDAVVARAREIRRLYDGLKAKLEVLRAEQREEAGDVAQTRSRMDELKAGFEALRAERDEIAGRLEQGSADLDHLEDELDQARRRHREEAAEAFQMIGEANRRISTIKARLGLIETEMQQLFGEIGRHVSRNAANNPSCREAIREYQSMVEVMRALRRSISLNHRLAGV